MADPNVRPTIDQVAEFINISSGQMSDNSTTSALKASGRGSSGGHLRLGRKSSCPDYNRKMMRLKYSFDFINNKSTDPTILLAQYTYYDWTETIKENNLRAERKKNDLAEYWTEIYQIIGFYSVFQGVIFQGVTSMATELSCGFYKIPIILSVLASAATFVGIYIKFTNILEQNRSLNEDVNHSKTIQDRIDFCEAYEDVSEFDIEKIAAHQSTLVYEERITKAFEHARYLKWAVLAFLAAFSAIFAHLDFVVMCHGYH